MMRRAELAGQELDRTLPIQSNANLVSQRVPQLRERISRSRITQLRHSQRLAQTFDQHCKPYYGN